MEASRGWYAVQPLLMIWCMWPLKPRGWHWKTCSRCRIRDRSSSRGSSICHVRKRKVSQMAVGAKVQSLLTSCLCCPTARCSNPVFCPAVCTPYLSPYIHFTPPELHISRDRFQYAVTIPSILVLIQSSYNFPPPHFPLSAPYCVLFHALSNLLGCNPLNQPTSPSKRIQKKNSHQASDPQSSPPKPASQSSSPHPHGPPPHPRCPLSW